MGACRAIPTSPPPRTVVVSFTLIADDTLHFAYITEASRADSAIPSDFAGVGPGRVSLHVVDPTGEEHPVAAMESPGKYFVKVMVRRGLTYQLTGTIDGELVSAETTVPQDFAILVPRGDTITSADGTANFVAITVPYVFDAEGVSSVAVRVFAGGGLRRQGQVVESSEGELFFLLNDAIRDIAFLAYDSGATEWLVRSTPRSNVAGAFGGFGSAILVRRKLWVP